MTTFPFFGNFLQPLLRLPEELGVLFQKASSDLALTNNSFFFSLFGTILVLTTIESEVQGFIEREFRLQKATLNVSFNSTTMGVTQINYRKSGADIPSLRITVPNGMTGSFTKKGSAIVLSGELINTCIIVNSSGTWQFWNLAYEIDIFLGTTV